MDVIIILTLTLVIIFLLAINGYLDKKNTELKWSINSKDVQIDHRDRLIELYQEQYGVIKQIIQSDTNEILSLRNDNEELRKRLEV